MVGLKDECSFQKAIKAGMLVDVTEVRKRIYPPDWKHSPYKGPKRFIAFSRSLWDLHVATETPRNPETEDVRLRQIMAGIAVDLRRGRYVNKPGRKSFFEYRPGGPTVINDNPCEYYVDPNVEKHLLCVRIVKGGSVYMLADEELDWDAPRVPGGNFFTM